MMNGLQVIKEPNKYGGLVQGLQNLLSGILQQSEQKRRTQDIGDIGGWARGGFQGQVPGGIQTDFGQQLAGSLLGSRYFDPVQRRYTESLTEAHKSLAEQRRRRKPTTKPLTTATMKGHAESMNSLLKKVERFRPGGRNYTQGRLLKAWKRFKEDTGFENLAEHHKKQVWDLWNNKIATRGEETVHLGGFAGGNEYEWDPTDPSVIEASGLGQQQISEDSVRLQTAPLVEFDEVWPQLNTKQKEGVWELSGSWDDLDTLEKQEIVQALRNNPDNIVEILRRLEGG